ncbi:hypothetical protein A3H26_02395 [candidate division WWE3 bacterium RIFCSPLOWO2_12_FULL_36_10]|uniref:Chromosomal replication initiator protein DnaA n=1 Tax=candidate division WWE3 bacterium RIFCSPLOWO2_12_FULL_36_10 TaxID=1802630 RepID=A0A1F4VIL8_UNCKA|nr:MAG: hypothetical protein A3H26_02395 [candidate division WWE3 bacterium RIFCSPLOWO2_12_FULL_36_10]
MEAKTLWKAVQAELELTLSELKYKMWIAPTRAGDLTDSSIEILCSTLPVRKKLETEFISLIQSSVNKIGTGNYKLIFKTGGVVQTESGAKSLGPLFEGKKDMGKEIENTLPNNSGLFPKYTFENYVAGSNNNLAYAIATSVADNPGKKYNPFFLYSGVGLGKTHLIQAIGNKIIKDKPKLRVIYVTGESFTNELIELLMSGKAKGKYTANKFREKYRSADVLLIDDIQFIAGRETTQEEFFHTFNTLYMNQKQIVITSDRPPNAFNNLEERITSRFGSGIIADIQTPDIDMRSAILRSKRDENKDDVSNEILDVIAQTIDTNVRELEGAYLQVLTYAKATGKEMSEDLVSKSLGMVVKEKKEKLVNLNQIIRAVCTYYSVKIPDIKGERRTKDLVVPRHMTMYLIHNLTQTPYMGIGEFMGGRDHTTIMHGVRKVEEEILSSQKTKQDASNIKSIIFEN